MVRTRSVDELRLLTKVGRLHEMLVSAGSEAVIIVDGGITIHTLPELIDSGVRLCCRKRDL